jgi:uncharacterized membrane protein YidH (DUF202 family)
MELENLKNLWHQLEKTETKVQISEIQTMLHQKSSDALAKLKNRLLFDVITGTIGAITFILMGIFSSDLAWKILGGFILLIYLPFVTLGWREYLKLRKVNLSNSNLKAQLSQLVGHWERGLNESLKIQQFLVPIGTLLGFWAGANWGSKGDFISRMFSRSFTEVKTYLIWGLVIIVLSLLLWFTNKYLKWYLKSVFGSQVNRLKECLQALAEEQ